MLWKHEKEIVSELKITTKEISTTLKCQEALQAPGFHGICYMSTDLGTVTCFLYNLEL